MKLHDMEAARLALRTTALKTKQQTNVRNPNTALRANCYVSDTPESTQESSVPQGQAADMLYRNKQTTEQQHGMC